MENPSGYIGPGVCRECHRQRVEEFVQTNHFRTARRPDINEMLAKLKSAGSLYQSRDPDCRFEITQRGQEFVQTAIIRSAAGEQRRSESIALVYGAGTADEVFHYWEGDQLFELPIAFMNPIQQWANAPGYHDGRSDFSRSTTPRCLECHNTWFEHVPGSANTYSRETFIPGVTCERCHGPAGRHVAYHRDHPESSDAMYVTNPGELSRDRQLEVCSQCHSNTQHRRTAPFSYRPGDILTDHFRIDQGTHPEKDHTANQIEYLRQSKCFQSDAAMTCTTCHNPHIPAGRDNAASVANSCYGCHEPDHCRDRKNIPAELRDQCIDCHMPERRIMNIWFSTATDEFIPLTRRHEHRIGVYPDAAKAVMLEWYGRSVDDSSREPAEALTREIIQAQLERAESLRRSHRSIAAIGAYREALRLQPSDPIRNSLNEVKQQLLDLEAAQRVAAQLLLVQDYAAAAENLQSMLQIKPNEAMVRGKLGLALASIGRRDEAVEQLTTVADHDPDLPYGDALLGWIYYLEDLPADSAHHYEIAIEKTPWNAKLQYQYALTLVKLDRLEAAEQCLRTALKIDPAHQPARDEINKLFRRK
ncbi:MAG: tetratricopeptide repeat protein [Fuerstiella sp.]